MLKDIQIRAYRYIVIASVIVITSCKNYTITQKSVYNTQTEVKYNGDVAYQSRKDQDKKANTGGNFNKNEIALQVCPEQSRKAEFCLEVYQPVCGWFTENMEHCKNSYCKENYANSCFACKDKRVVGYTAGKCSQ